MLSLSVLTSASAWAADQQGMTRGTPDLKSADVLAFGPDDVLFVGDNKSAAVFAIATGNKEGNPAQAEFCIENVSKAISDVVGEEAAVTDLVVNPSTGHVFVAVAAAGKPAIVQVDGAGKITELSLADVRFSKASLSDAPADKEVSDGRRSRNNRSDTITDLAFYEGKVLVSGLRDAGAPSSIRELNFPFAAADKGVSVQIYHAAHGRDEDYAAARTIVPMTIDGQPSLLAAYVCTPLVKIPLKDVEGGKEKVTGTTVAELGNRNRPLDMITYDKAGNTFLLLSNSARGVMKITTTGLSENSGLSEPVRGGGTAGQTYETIESLHGVVQMDKLNDSHAVVLTQSDDGQQKLMTVVLP